jgi:hypothetical protein
MDLRAKLELRREINEHITRIRGLMVGAPPEKRADLAEEIAFAEQMLRSGRGIDLARAHSNLKRIV